MTLRDRILPGGSGPFIPYAVTEAEMRLQIKLHLWPFYVYALCTPTGAAFYIGKGAGHRIFAHAVEAAAGGQSEKCRVIRQLGGDLRYGIVLSCADESYALAFESFHIRGNFDCIANLANGTEQALYGMCDMTEGGRLWAAAHGMVGAALRLMDETEDAAMQVAIKHPSTRAALFPGVTWQ